METENKHKRLNDALREFTGTETYYKHLTGYLYTDGVQFLAQEYGAYWLVDEILIANQPPLEEEFQVWTLQRKPGTDAFQLTCKNGNYTLLYTKAIPFSDFTADSVELWFSNGVLYLPYEH